VLFAKVTLVGLGLLGGSIGLAIRRAGLAACVQGYARRAETAREAVQRAVVHAGSTDLAEAVRDADCVILCTPVAQMLPLAEQMRAHLKAGVVVTDVGSVKSSLVQALGPLFGAVGGHFVGSHPMAGSEKNGVTAARVNLFDDAVCVVTPIEGTDAAALASVHRLWSGLGARVVVLPPERHDALVAKSSHLPHAVAATLARAVLGSEHSPEQELVCASGFRDTTRVASGSPEMWRDIALANAPHLEIALADFLHEFVQLRDALAARDGAALLRYFAEARQWRDTWIESRGESLDPPN